MIRLPPIRDVLDRCGNRPQDPPVIDREQLTLFRASVIVGSEPMECKTGSGVRRRSVGHTYQVPFPNVGPAGGRYKTHSGGVRVRVPAVQFNRSYP